MRGFYSGQRWWWVHQVRVWLLPLLLLRQLPLLHGAGGKLSLPLIALNIMSDRLVMSSRWLGSMAITTAASYTAATAAAAAVGRVCQLHD